MTDPPFLYLHSEGGGACGVTVQHGFYHFNESNKHHTKEFLLLSASPQLNSWARKDKEN